MYDMLLGQLRINILPEITPDRQVVEASSFSD